MFAHSINRAGVLRRGFTLIEILAVVIILGIMSAVIIPQMGTRDSSRVASAARQLTADLIYAQSRAVTLQKTQYVVFNTAGDKYDLASSYSPLVIITNPVTSGSYETVFGQSPLEGVTLGSVSFDGQTTVAFNELGVPMSVSTAGVAQTLNSGAVVIQAPNASLTVSVQPYSGEVKVQ